MPDVQASTSVSTVSPCSFSVTSYSFSSAPASSSEPVSVFLLMDTFVTSSFMVTSVTLLVLSTVNFTSSEYAYPSGACSSWSVYSLPAISLPLISCGLSVDVHSSTTSPFSSLIWSVAPGISLSPVMSFLLMDTFVTSSFMVTSVTLLVLSTVNFTSSEYAYPSGACSSWSVYSLPAISLPLISCGLSVDVHSSTTSPFSSLIWRVAPGISLSPVMSFLLMDTLVTSSFMVTSVTFPVSSTVNFTSSEYAYPSGACSSWSVYSLPAISLPLISCGLSVDVHSSTTSPFSSLIWRVAPGISLSPVMSFLLMDTLVTSSFMVTSVTFPVSSTVNFTSSEYAYPSGACSSWSVYSLPAISLPLISCGLSVDVHSSTTSPFSSLIWRVAPGISLSPVMSFLLMVTLVVSSSMRTVPLTSSPFIVTLPAASTTNSMDSATV